MDVAVKVGLYLGAVLLLGAGVFARWVGPVGDDRARRRLVIGWSLGIALLAVGSLADAAGALARALGAFDLARLPAYLFDTRHGNAVLGRLGLILIVAALGPAGIYRPVVDRPAFVAAGGLLLVTFSLTSHAAGTGRAPVIAADLLHLAAMAAWAGSVVYLAWLPLWPPAARADPRLPRALQAVSSLGLVAVGVLAGTGVFAAAQHLWGAPALAQTPYGQALLAKVAVFGVVLAVAGANRWVLLPAIAARPAQAAFGALVRVEAVALAGVLIATGVLTTRPLPEAPATLAQVVAFREAAGPWVVRGSLSPRAAAGFDLEMSVLDARGAPPAEDVSVRLGMTMLDHEMPPVSVVAERLGRGAYRAAVPLVMAGAWQIAIEVPGGVVRVPVQARATVETPPGWERGVPGLAGVLAGGALGVYALRRLGARAAAAAPLLAASAALVVLSATLGVRALGAAPPQAGLLDRTNPIPPTAESLAAGERIYRQHCQACHGVTGAGDGPAAAMLRPRPSDLRVHMAAGHTDGQLYFWITEGFAGTAMPAFRATLSEEERWHVLNFIRTFALTDR